MPAPQQGGVTQADAFGHGNDDWDEVIAPPEDEYEILVLNK